MTSFIRSSDISPDEFNLLPIAGLKQQIHEDRNRCSSPGSRTGKKARAGSLRGHALQQQGPLASVSPAVSDGFFTEWQLEPEPHCGST